MSSIYIAGPMRGYPQFNFPAFDRASALGRSLGWTVISPAEMDREHGIDETKHTKGADVFNHEQIREFIRRDVNVLVNILKPENGDAIAMLPGWEKSTGATGELALAKWAKLRVLNAETFEPLDQTQAEVVSSVLGERRKQDEKWGVQHHNPETWLAILTEEVGELAECILHKKFGGSAAENMEAEAVQVAAVGVAILEDLRRSRA